MPAAPRFLLVALAVACAVALGAPAGATAKGDAMDVRIQSQATNLRAGQPRDVTFTLVAAPGALQRLHEPAVWIEDSGLTPATFFKAHPTGKPGQYHARVTFPSAGRWTYSVGERQGRFFDFRATVRAAAKHERSALPGATPLAALGLCLAIGCAGLVRRRRAAG
jgi:hypothetical protein